MSADRDDPEPSRAADGGAEIRVLSDQVINQIAAGEVIERPASVVKELVENSIDAGAHRIAVEIEGGGKTLIRVVDDGCGMSRADLRLALTRHATSKLRETADLTGIATMGFRGEALPSIAAVSRFAVTSKRRGGSHPAAFRLEVVGGELAGEQEVGAPVGTSIEVRDLLFNLPVRQTFMKAEATESAHIADCVSKLALAHPFIHFRLRQNGRATLDAPASRHGLERAAVVLGRKASGELVAESGEGGGVRVTAYVGPPAAAQKSARSIQLFVGRRAIRDRGLLHAVVAGYGDRIGAGRYPCAVVFVEVSGEKVDVNVHPQKLEVRFSDGQAVYAVVKGVVERAVGKGGWVRAEDSPVAEVGGSASAAAVAGPTRAAERLAAYGASRRLFAPGAMIPRRQREPRPAPPPRNEASAPPAAARSADGVFARLRYLATLDGRYLLCEDDGELVVIDAARARQRLAAARLLAEHRRRAISAQRLLLPLPIECDRDQRAALVSRASDLARLGIEVGEGGSALLATPAGLLPERAARLALDLLEARGLRAQLAAIASALESSPPVELDRAEASRLLASLDEVDELDKLERRDQGGQKIVVRIPTAEIARRFS